MSVVGPNESESGKGGGAATRSFPKDYNNGTSGDRLLLPYPADIKPNISLSHTRAKKHGNSCPLMKLRVAVAVCGSSPDPSAPRLVPSFTRNLHDLYYITMAGMWLGRVLGR